jgi:hypothetical protein
MKRFKSVRKQAGSVRKQGGFVRRRFIEKIAWQAAVAYKESCFVSLLERLVGRFGFALLALLLGVEPLAALVISLQSYLIGWLVYQTIGPEASFRVSHPFE